MKEIVQILIKIVSWHLNLWCQLQNLQTWLENFDQSVDRSWFRWAQTHKNSQNTLQKAAEAALVGAVFTIRCSGNAASVINVQRGHMWSSHSSDWLPTKTEVDVELDLEFY